MNELIQKVMNVSGVSEDQATKAVTTVTQYLKERMPDALKGQVDNLANGGTLSSGLKQKLNDVAGDWRDEAEKVIETLRNKADEVFSKKK
jgi:uncharacterized protein (DUF2267 family)